MSMSNSFSFHQSVSDRYPASGLSLSGLLQQIVNPDVTRGIPCLAAMGACVFGV